MMCKRAKPGELKDVKDCILKWLRKCHDKNVSIKGLVLQEKAEQFVEKLGHASNSWLQNIKKRKE